MICEDLGKSPNLLGPLCSSIYPPNKNVQFSSKLQVWIYEEPKKKKKKKQWLKYSPSSLSLFIYLFIFFVFAGPHPRHMKIPRLWVTSERQLPAYTTVIVTRDPSLFCDLHHGSWQHQILNPLSKARDWTHNLMVPSQIHFRCTTMGTPCFVF